MKKYSTLLILILSIILQATLVPYMSIGWFRPDLPLLVITWIALRKGALRGIGTAFIAGLLIDALGTGYLGLSSLSYSCAAFIMGKFFHQESKINILQWIINSGISALVYSLIFANFYSLDSTVTFWQMFFYHALPTAFYTWALGSLWSLTPMYE